METAASAGEAEGGFVEALELELGVEGAFGTCRRKGGTRAGRRPSHERSGMFSGCIVRPA